MVLETYLGYSGYWYVSQMSSAAEADGGRQQPMRNTAPALSQVQLSETSLPGNIDVHVDASNATVSGDDAHHANSGNTLVLPPMDPHRPKTRCINIFAHGTAGCDRTLTPSADTVTVSPASGSTAGNNGTATRVYVSIDWTRAPPAPNSTTVNIEVVSSCAWLYEGENNYWGPYHARNVQVPVINPELPTSFLVSSKVISISP